MFAVKTLSLQQLINICSVKIKEVVSALERFAPLPLQADFDNAGLQVGLTEAELSGALLCLDVTEPIVDEAIRLGCNLIVAHHPLIFRKLSCISNQNYVQRTVMKAIQNHITIVAMHTNMDSAKGGVNYKIAEKLGLQNLSFIGKEQIVDGVTGGEGVVGTFAEGQAADDFISLLKRVFEVECVQANQLLRRPIKRVALCGGSGAFLLSDALQAGADAFVTGEMSYHDFFDMEQRIQLAVIGHYQSEQFTSEIFKEIIQKQFPEAHCCISSINTNPIIYF